MKLEISRSEAEIIVTGLAATIVQLAYDQIRDADRRRLAERITEIYAAMSEES